MNNKKKLVKRIKIVDPSKNVGYKKPKIQQSSNGSAVEPTKMMHTKKEHDSIQEGKEMFEWIINPMSVNDFMENYWEKKPKHIKRPNNKNYYHSLMTMQTIQNMIRENHLEYTKNVDITSYRDGIRETHNPEGKVTSSLWSFYDEGCSIRLLNPQTFVPTVFKMNAKLQEYFHCMVGTNVYLTPKDSQGFAPHYDDIEAFILQVEGQKHWRIYEPRTADEFLARTSSINFSQDEIGEPIMDILLEAGEMLYFPRGFIHQGVAIDGQHSLHITVSMYQKNSYADLLEHLVPAALKQAIESDARFREGLPLNIHQVCGSVYSDVDSNDRNEVRDHIKELFSRIFDHANIDNAVDQMSKKFQTDALPPHISKHEKQRTAFGERVEIEDGEVSLPFEITAETNIRLLKANILRLVEEEDTYRVYFHTENSKEYHEFEPTFMEIEEDDTVVIAKLVHSYPDFIAVSDLPAEDDERKIAIVSDLWEKGLLMTDVTVD